MHRRPKRPSKRVGALVAVELTEKHHLYHLLMRLFAKKVLKDIGYGLLLWTHFIFILFNEF